MWTHTGVYDLHGFNGKTKHVAQLIEHVLSELSVGRYVQVRILSHKQYLIIRPKNPMHFLLQYVRIILYSIAFSIGEISVAINQ